MRLSFLIILSGIFLSVAAKDLVIVSNPPGEKINTGKCVLYGEKNDSIGSVAISDKGILSLPDGGYRYAEIHADGFAPKLVDIARQQSDTVYLRPNTTLDELVVTPDFMQDLGNHKSYRIPMTDMERYPNFLMALNEIPMLQILPGGGAYYQGNENIAFLLNGVSTTFAELQTISKEDIAKVDVYSEPPARFAAQGISTVIDVRTKSNITGGNFGMDVDQTFYPLKGNNSAAFYYNYRRSRFSLLYSGRNQHNDKIRQNEKLKYEFDGVKYEKTKTGKNSPNDINNNNVTLSFQNNKVDNYLYNLQVGMAFDNEKRDAYQDVTTEFGKFNASNFFHSKYQKYNISNYFEKHFGEEAKYGTFLANVNFQHFDTRYVSSYQEYGSHAEDDLVNNYSAYKTRLDGVFAELQYELPKNRLGWFSLSVSGNYKHNKYVESSNPFYQKTGDLIGNVSWSSYWKKIVWYAILGVNSNWESTTLLKSTSNVVIPYTRLKLGWRPGAGVTLDAFYSYSLQAPSIAQLSETVQWLDTKLAYHGNPTLKQSKIHEFEIVGAFVNPYIRATLYFRYNYSPDMICNQYLTTDKYMLETIVNLDSYKELMGQLYLAIMPLGNSKLVLTTLARYAHIKGVNPQYNWDGYKFQWMSTMSLNLKKWSFSAFYQYPGHVTVGQLVKPRTQAWYVMGMFRPINDLSVGLKLMMPFGDGFHEGEYTVKDAPVYWDKALVTDRAESNYVSLLFSWNISFGRNKNSAKPRLSVGDDDSGILKK